MDPEHYPTPDSDVETVVPEPLKDRIDGGEEVTRLDARMESEYEEIIATNLGQTTVDDEAFALELGPNNCAASQESLAGD